MRLGSISINGTEYPLCFSASILVSLEERGEDVSDILKGDNMSLTNIFRLLSQMIEAGVKYKRLTGGCDLEPLTFEEITVLLAPEDFPKVMEAVNNTIASGQKRTVEAAPPKNSKNVGATREAD